MRGTASSVSLSHADFTTRRNNPTSRNFIFSFRTRPIAYGPFTMGASTRLPHSVHEPS
jgi:hypothetical protein